MNTANKPPTIRLPVRVTVYDSELKEFQTPPVWIEIPQPTESKCHWDWLSKIETEAKSILITDMECAVDWDAMKQAKLFHRDSVAEVEPEQAISCEVREENGK